MEKFLPKYFDLKPPVFGLNFVESQKNMNKDFMLLCGFENFNKIFVRIDMLERLFLMILNTKKEISEKQKDIKLIPEMLNLLGCKKESFIKLLKNMNYKTFEKDKDVYFRFIPAKRGFKPSKKNIKVSDSPFSKLVQLNIK